MAAQIQHKRGDTFEAQCTYKNPDGTPHSLAGIAMSGQFRRPNDTLLTNIDITVTDEDNGGYSLSVADTSLWPLGVVSFDIQYIINGKTTSTETVEVEIVKDITHG